MAVRFLIADDYSAHQKLMANIIQFLGGAMRYAATGHEAMHLAQTEEFDVVLMDLQMPGLGGVAAADRLIHGWSEHPHRPRIIAVTADNTSERRALCRAVGMDGFITKPYEATTLKNALQRVIMFGHCWTDGEPERTLDMKRFLKAAAAWDFESWAQAAPEALREAATDAEALSEIRQQAHTFGFLLLERSIEAFTNSGAESSIEGAISDLRLGITVGQEALSMMRDESLAAA
jgi:CheY-like chemotaxis protein